MTFPEWVAESRISKGEPHPGDMQIERPRLGRERDRDSEQEQTRWTRGKQGQEASGIDSSLYTWEQHRKFLFPEAEAKLTYPVYPETTDSSPSGAPSNESECLSPV